MAEVVNLSEFEPLARANMAPAAFDYYAGGAADEVTLRENALAFSRRRLRPRVLTGAYPIEPATTLLGQRVSLPIGLAPAAYHRLAHPDGEAATARAASRAGALLCASTMSSCALEEIAAAGDGPKWFQLYPHRDRGVTRALLARAKAAGFSAVVLTADLPVFGRRERDLRNGFALPAETLGNFAAMAKDRDDLIRLLGGLHDEGLSWRDLEWVIGATGLPLVVKGLLTAEDAALAVTHGAGAVWVSNHGGRQLDRSVASLDALEEVVAAVGGRAEVYLDGGVRRGADAAIALALGARAVFVGRPYLFALAAAGEAGVARALEILRDELINAMALLGARTPSELSPAHIKVTR